MAQQGAEVNPTATQENVETTKLAPRWVYVVMALAILMVVAVFITIIIWVPPLLVEQRKASDDTYVKAITDNRTALIQAFGGFGVFLGVVVGFFTLRHNRQLLQAGRKEHVETLQASHDALERTLALTERGQVADRFAKAIEQLGQPAADAIDLRLGGIYALEQIYRDHDYWRRPVVEVLAAFIRQHVVGLAPPEGESVEAQMAALDNEPNPVIDLRTDIGAALNVLSKRERSGAFIPVDLSRADFRRVTFPFDIDFRGTNLGFAQMQFSNLYMANMSGCFLFATNLVAADLKDADLSRSRLSFAKLDRANLAGATLTDADLTEVDLSGVRDLTIEQLKVAKIGPSTKLPDYIDRAALLKVLEPSSPNS